MNSGPQWWPKCRFLARRFVVSLRRYRQRPDWQWRLVVLSAINDISPSIYIRSLLGWSIFDFSTNATTMVRAKISSTRFTWPPKEPWITLRLGQLGGRLFENRRQPCFAPLIAWRLLIFTISASFMCPLFHGLCAYMAHSVSNPRYRRKWQYTAGRSQFQQCCKSE